jgi:hypothetical protein
MRGLFALSATENAISTAEEGEIRRIAKELRIDHPDLSHCASRTSGSFRVCRASNERISQDPAHRWSGRSGIV